MQFRNILIVRTDRIGDVVLTTPAIKALRQAYPAARISVLVASLTYDLVKGNPYLDEILVDDRVGRHRGPFGFLRLVREIRSHQFDLAVIFHTKRRYNLACFTAGIPYRLGYQNNKLGFLLNYPLKDVRHEGQMHEAQYCLEVLKTIGVKAADLDIFVPIQKQGEEWIVQWMLENNVNANEYIVIHPGSSDPAKCWLPSNFALLMDRLAERYPYKIILMGSASTIPVADEILRQTSRRSQFLDLTGKTSLAQTVSLLRRSRLLISNDSGPVHVAAGLERNVISLFLRNEPGINPERWKPLGPKSHILCNTPSPFTIEDIMGLTARIFLKNDQYEIF